ncbi:MAG: DUF4956 domain-containing protein [Lachnospiraceae bacterium]|nr:DUF4956 domain-containing protein [Lachnospiraceae bacterium]
MATFGNIFKKSFLEGYSSVTLGTTQIVVVLALTCLIGLYIFFCYRLMTRRTFYSKSFNISLVLIAMITAAIIMTVQSSIVISLGMVGALSIVRFRTAVKEPLDLAFLFWSISVGIICGAGLAEIAIFLSFAATVVLFVLDKVPVARAPMILVVNAEEGQEVNEAILASVKKYSRFYTEKSRVLSDGRMNLVFELRVSEGEKLTGELSAMEKVSSVSLLSHDGEVTF